MIFVSERKLVVNNIKQEKQEKQEKRGGKRKTVEVIIGQNFIDKRIVLDNKAFDDCHFTGCLFLYGGSPFQFTDSCFTDIRVRFFGEALNTIRLLAKWEIDPQKFINDAANRDTFDLSTVIPAGGTQ